MPQRPPWTAPTGLPVSDQRQLSTRLETSLYDLENYIRQIHQENSFGPVPGAYHVFTFRASTSGGLTTGIKDGIGLVVEFRPIFVSAWARGGNLTLQLREVTGGSPSDLLTSDLVATDSLAATLNARSDFLTEKVAADWIDLEILSIDSGTPVEIHVELWAKNLSKVEPA